MQWELVEALVEQMRRWGGPAKRVCLMRLAVSRSVYYRWRAGSGSPRRPGARPRQPHALLPAERTAVVHYALEHPNPRHRELAWRMVDEEVAYVSASTVYRILREEGLVPTWPSGRCKRYREPAEKARQPDERWQTDIRYIRIARHTYYLVIFLDEHSRYVVHHELMCYLDGDTLSLEAQRAIETLGETSRRPDIQSDNGSGYLSGEFKQVLTEHKLTHVRIRPHCPEENGLVERLHRTVAEALDDHELRDLAHARTVVADIVRWYNEERLHSALHYLRPIDYYRGEPQHLLEERRRKLAVARHHRHERNLGLRQPTFAFEAMDSEVRRPPISRPICPT
ncbi:MAG TPA: integrase core domain-containing protein [Phycisphaerae bacterium]|nr:integrase core domain-containing protein [Phycisphaerae bacterium]